MLDWSEKWKANPGNYQKRIQQEVLLQPWHVEIMCAEILSQDVP